MEFRRDESTRTVRTPAKLNLYLEVLGRRCDGYHELETLMVPIALWDSLTLTPMPPPRDDQAGEIAFDVRSTLAAPPADAELPRGKANLVVRALELLRVRSGCRAGAHVTLVKRIPTAAGLGGGSSDAAAALRLGNHAWRLDWSADQLAELGAELGSDVPFFVKRRPAVCRGRGERIETLVGTRRFHAVLVKPPFGLSTPDVFRAHDALPVQNASSGDRLNAAVGALRKADWSRLASSLTNSLEAAAVSLAPWIGEVRAVFERLRCMGHQLSGSGSAYFGLCSHSAQAQRLAARLRTERLGLVCAVRSCP